MKATRDGFGDELLEHGADDRLFVLTADLGGPTRVSEFSKRFPERFLDVGIAEANMIGVAAGLALEGRRVVATSFASFLTGRYDQIRCSLAYQLAPVILVGTHAGMAIGRDGVTQMGLEDVALMRALPGMRVVQPATYSEARAWTRRLLTEDLAGPVYLRLHRQPAPDDGGTEALPWRWVARRGGEPEIVLVTSGATVATVREVCARAPYVSAVAVAELKPFPVDVANLCCCAHLVVTVEDHVVTGGLGSAVAEVMAEARSTARLVRIGLRDVFPESGRPEDLYAKYGITADAIMEVVRK